MDKVIPRILPISLKTFDANCGPLSEIILSGSPNLL